MRPYLKAVALMTLVISATAAAEKPETTAKLYPSVQKYVEHRVGEFGQIPDDRKARLKKIALYVKSQIKAGQPARLTFICTHNSRRSHMSQIWSATAAKFYGIANVETFSGGTEATAFNPRAIAAIERAGLKVEKTEDAKNSKFAVRFQDTEHPMICFSKVYSDPPNPKENFCAVMTCDQADKNCPSVDGCSLRVAVPFDDPKVADNTPEEAAKYDERCRQISREMLFLFSLVGN